MALKLSQLTLDRVFGYPGGRVISVDYQTIAFACGSGLFFYDYSTGTKSSIWPDDSFAIGALAFHRKRKLVACSEKSRRPRVFLVSYPSTNVVGVLEDVAVHEVQDIAFSRCGNYLAVLGSLPDFNVSLFDISEKPRLLARGPLSGAPCHFITFNPHDPSVLCCSGSGHVVFWKYVKSISGNVSFSYKAGRVPVGEKTRYGFHSHCWNTKNEVICGTTHAELFQFDSLTCEGEEIINNVGQGTITSLLYSKDFIIVGSESGSVSCIGSTSNERICSMPVIQAIHSLDFTADFKKIIVSGGSQISLLNPLPNESGDVIADFHTGSITGLAQYTDDYVVSCGTDGTIRVWYLEMNTMMFKLETNVEFSCISINSKAGLAFCGTNDGSMHIFSIDAGSLQFSLLTSFRQHTGPIADIIINPNGTQIVCGGADKEVSFFEWEEGTESVYSIGNITMKSCVTSIAYQDGKGMYLVALDQGDLCQCVFPNSEEDCKWDIVVKCMWTLDFASFGIQVKPDQNDVLVSIAQDRRVRLYHLTPPAGDDAYERQLMSDIALAGSHEKNGRAIVVSRSFLPYVFTGAKDGYVAVHNMNQADHLPEKLLVHDHWKGGISRLLFVEKWMCLVSAGFDGVLFASSFGGDSAMKMVRPLSIGFSAEIELPINGAKEKGSLKGRSAVHAVASAQEEEEVAKLKEELDNIRTSLGELLHENENAPELEKLDREEFLIDESNRSKLIAQTDERLDAIRKQTHLDRLGMMFLADIIKKRCYDTMEQHFVYVRGMKRDVEVTNFPLLKKDPKNEKILKKLKILRLVEREEHIRSGRHCFTALEQLTKATLIAKERVDSHPRHMSSVSELPDISDIDVKKPPLWYEKYDLYAPSRRRMHMKMLEHEIRERKENYNSSFSKLQDRKHQVVAMIEEKNKRILEIAEELGEPCDDLFHPMFADDEMADSILQVHDHEIVVEKVLSEEEKAEIARKEAEETAARAARQDEDAVERALLDMMDGKLEKPQEKEFDHEMERPEWMNKPSDEMTEDELEEVARFEKALEKWRDERTKYRKALEAEERKLIGEVEKLCEEFDEEILQTLEQRLKTDQEVCVLETLLIKCGQGILQFEVDMDQEEQFAKELDELREKKTSTSSLISEHQEDLEKLEEELQEFIQEDKITEKSFKTRFSDAEGFVDVLYRLYRKRPTQMHTGDADGGATDGLGAVDEDPYADVDLSAAKASARRGDFLPDKDCPEGLSPLIWNRFQEDRMQKIEFERMIESRQANLEERRQTLEKLKAADAEYDEMLQLSMKEMNVFRDEQFRDMFDLDDVFELRQGQVEVEQAAVVTDYADAILIDQALIQDLNGVIREHGTEKIDILKDIKDLRREIHKLEWQKGILQTRIVNDEEEIRDLQLLRVTKKMQETLRSGSAVVASDLERKKLEKTLDHMKASSSQKVKESKKRVIAAERKAGKIQEENVLLQDEIAKLSETLREKQRIYEAQNLGAEQKVVEKTMKDLRVIRKLADLRDAQVLELEALRKELERLRERTFPSFAVQRRRVRGNVDQRP
eukprot:TRINITY_DN284_c0_g1_i1.p1 TRINITY_DN284_c0_g1~~TRINITY_DN284_c0_g1_i1.p1  ORF type:complete len:1547 (-),score=503.49 TRINITY_DN284_c0_g1_i1:1400-6040(-)